MSVRERPRAGERESRLSVHKLNFVAKTRCVDLILLFTVFICLASVSLVFCCKTFEITEIIWRSDTEL